MPAATVATVFPSTSCRCTSVVCRHSKLKKDHGEFVDYREYQHWSNINGITNLINRERDRNLGLAPVQGFYRPLKGGKYKQVAPSGYMAMAETWGAEVLDNLLCLCALDPSIKTPAARARVVDRTREGGGWVLTCHRAPKVVRGELDYTNTCGMEMKIHYYVKNSPAIPADALPQHAIRLPAPLPQKPYKAPTTTPAAAAKRRHSEGNGSVIDLTESD
ncbi:hypothetical protein AURDEDRAFT_131726 [Auricularia subglabra TFB-10046 SS5]|uniref:Uncharacterized protein n=1 Tax=Auricularia subglabra (strain TFB-10046 / SS5) TaxID=717982 RepID=J0LAB7_AURST|nr:hypothetical protein AURDEDRAFT_131726 [Auricularia subglabra TFB-10046 SS5]